MHAELSQALAEVRDRAKITQRQVADKMGVHQSKVSRMEQGEVPSAEDALAYLQAVATPTAIRLAQAIETTWRHLPRPPFLHPDLQLLVRIEEGLERLDTFRKGESVPHVLVGQADLLFRRLFEFGEYLNRLDHRVVYVGDIGVGKTTAACMQAGLVVDPSAGQDLKGLMLDTGGGRTTLCDVIVLKGDRYSIRVEPLPDEEVYRLVTELCRGLKERKEGEPTASAPDFRPPEEVERALRNMAQLPRPARRRGAPPVPDPASELAALAPSLEDFKAEFASRLTLWRRTRRTIDYDGADTGAARQWLRETFVAINNGRHPDFSLPGTISITVPFAPVAGGIYEVSMVDTRGVDGSAVRPDLLMQLKDRRALAILCSSWGSAPDTSLQELLKHLAETDVDPTLLSRVGILVLARAGDALSMRHDSGEGALDAYDGYEIKRGHVEDALQRINLAGIDITEFDAANDSSDELTQFLVDKIARYRQAQAEGAAQTIAAIDEMLQNVEKAQALAALEAINNELRIFADRHRRLKETRRPLHGRLIEAVRQRHPRTVWAATRRNGSFWNFDVYQHIGDGAAADARRRANGPIAGLREIIANKLADEAFSAAHGFLGQVLDNVDQWEADFMKAARHHAIAVFRPVLSIDSALWDLCEGKYGWGLPYKQEIATALEEWFEAHEELQEAVDRRIARAWRLSVLTPLMKAAGGMASEADDEV